jgi:hypothetical protein
MTVARKGETGGTALLLSRRTVLCLAAVACVLSATPARGDGGILRYSTRTRGLDISIFTDPTPVRTGTLDVSVLVRPIPITETRPLPAFQVCAYPLAAPAKRQCESATTEVATNKLFRAAQLQLTQPGLWQVEIEIDSADGQFLAIFQIPVEDAYPDWVTIGVWVALPVVAILLFVVHRWLVRRRERAETPPLPAEPSHGGS